MPATVLVSSLSRSVISARASPRAATARPWQASVFPVRPGPVPCVVRPAQNRQGAGAAVHPGCLAPPVYGPGGLISLRLASSQLKATCFAAADVYSRGESEEIVGRAVKDRRDEVVLATKFAMPMGADDNQRGGSPRWIKRAVEDSLRRLGTDYIDLYQMHRPDYTTDIEESLSALDDLVREGKVRAIGSR